jgi:hypothetical protein
MRERMNQIGGDLVLKQRPGLEVQAMFSLVPTPMSRPAREAAGSTGRTPGF